jgi:hypothetical protein
MRDRPLGVRPGEQAAQAGIRAIDRRGFCAIGELALLLPVEQIAFHHQR